MLPGPIETGKGAKSVDMEKAVTVVETTEPSKSAEMAEIRRQVEAMEGQLKKLWEDQHCIKAKLAWANLQHSRVDADPLDAEKLPKGTFEESMLISHVDVEPKPPAQSKRGEQLTLVEDHTNKVAGELEPKVPDQKKVEERALDAADSDTNVRGSLGEEADVASASLDAQVPNQKDGLTEEDEQELEKVACSQ